MKCLILVCVIWSVGYLQVASGSPRPGPPRPPAPPPKDDTLVLAHVLFRHGHRTPNSKIYSNNPISNESFYWPEGYGQLTNTGKQREYNIGRSLRRRYDNFLGADYNYNFVEARTTNVNRTKNSLQLVLAGLYPPSPRLRWSPWLAWQPIPYNYLTNDKELSGTSVCSNYNTLKTEVQNSAEIQEKLSVYDDVFEYLNNQTGETYSAPQGAFNFYFESIAQSDYGYPVEDWLLPVFPETLAKITKDVYYIGANTTALRRIAGGFLLRKIINDSKAKIDGLLTPDTRKIFLYSAHETNVAYLLLTLGVFEDKIPAYGSQVIVELHKIDDTYGFKVFYHDWTTSEPYPLVIPGCEEFCPYDDFVSLLSEVIPEDSDCETS